MAYNVFRNRMNAKGGTAYERNLRNKSREFEQWFNESIGRELVTIDGIEQHAVFQDQNQNNNKDLSDDKYMVVENSSNVKVGSIVGWRNKVWMVFSEENKTIPTHKQTKVKQSNGYIKWMIGDRVSGNGQGYPAFIQNQTLYTLGVSTSGSHSWIVNAKMMMYMPDNVETRAIRIGQRVFIGGAVYQVMFKDYVSRKGLINYLLEEDFVNESRDHVELGIADYYLNVAHDDVQEPTGVTKEITINGADKARIGTLVRYDASVYEGGVLSSDGITDWTIADTEAVATVVEQTPTYITLRIENNFKKVGSVISIIGKTADGTIGSKSVNIVSPY